MADERAPGAPTTRRYTKAQKDQAIRLVRQIREETGERHGAVRRVARQVGFGVETVRNWVTRPMSMSRSGPGRPPAARTGGYGAHEG